MQRVIVTGGGGFVGKAVVRLLIARGISTTVIGRNDYPEVREMGARVARGDIRDPQFLTTVFREHDTVFHVAAKAGIWGDYQDYFSINVQGTENVLAACRTSGISRLVYTSTPSVVFRSGDLAGVDEGAPYADIFLCHYAETKVLAEKMVLGANCRHLLTTALRPHLVWGPGDTNLIPRLLARGRSRQLKIVGTGENLVDISYIDNVASAHLLAAENLENSASAAGQAYFISQGEPVNLWNWINWLFTRLEIPQVTRQVSFGKAYAAGFVFEKLYSLLGRSEEPPMTRFLAEQLAKSHWFSMEKARRDFGYNVEVSTAEGVDRLVAWLSRKQN
ncbi:MAG: NAD-dependent epimerase/dehydratase family protein [Proteobacteria bacterium]|nr:NAD-dependent epimerase/dehydratase family protein [Pseudomonadota bacterium]MBU4297110.1 NAD-dependent epimerase/dehydratase family protein [Pseudomonadota bacterium]MCG2746532.1 NAD-dependent epimerase/dehydratase family protein [Desulfobulbaceae bacterium]